VKRVTLLGISLLALLAAAAPTTAAPGAPKILEAQYYEDFEDGYRYNISVVIRGDVEKVTAKSGSLRTNGHSGHIGVPGRNKTTWFFREKRFVKRVRADFEADDLATLIVKASNDKGVTKKACELVLEHDPPLEDFAEGDCHKR
jgi:hypothetical protein